MREDGAPVTWPGIVCCVRLAHTADRAAHCYVSYLLHTSDSAHAAHTRPGLVFACLESFYISHITPVACSQPGQAADILLLSCLARRDLRIPRSGPALTHKALQASR